MTSLSPADSDAEDDNFSDHAMQHTSTSEVQFDLNNVLDSWKTSMTEPRTGRKPRITRIALPTLSQRPYVLNQTRSAPMPAPRSSAAQMRPVVSCLLSDNVSSALPQFYDGHFATAAATATIPVPKTFSSGSIAPFQRKPRFRYHLATSSVVPTAADRVPAIGRVPLPPSLAHGSSEAPTGYCLPSVASMTSAPTTALRSAKGAQLTNAHSHASEGLSRDATHCSFDASLLLPPSIRKRLIVAPFEIPLPTMSGGAVHKVADANRYATLSQSGTQPLDGSKERPFTLDDSFSREMDAVLLTSTKPRPPPALLRLLKEDRSAALSTAEDTWLRFDDSAFTVPIPRRIAAFKRTATGSQPPLRKVTVDLTAEESTDGDANSACFGGHRKRGSRKGARKRKKPMTGLSEDSERGKRRKRRRKHKRRDRKKRAAVGGRSEQLSAYCVPQGEDDFGGAEVSEELIALSELLLESGMLDLQGFEAKVATNVGVASRIRPSAGEENARGWVEGRPVSDERLVDCYLDVSRKRGKRLIREVSEAKHCKSAQMKGSYVADNSWRFEQRLHVGASGFLGLWQRSDIFDDCYNEVYDFLNRDRKSVKRLRVPKQFRKRLKLPQPKMSRTQIKKDIKQMCDSQTGAKGNGNGFAAKSRNCVTFSDEFATFRKLVEGWRSEYRESLPNLVRMNAAFAMERFRGSFGRIVDRLADGSFVVELFEYCPSFRVNATRQCFDAMDDERKHKSVESDMPLFDTGLKFSSSKQSTGCQQLSAAPRVATRTRASNSQSAAVRSYAYDAKDLKSLFASSLPPVPPFLPV